MAIPANLQFQLVNTNDGYLEFVVSYALGEDRWMVSGIGWMSGATPKYYLRLLRLNGKPAPESIYSSAKVVLKKASYKFKKGKLDALVLESIENIFQKMPDLKQTDTGVEGMTLIPRRPSKR